MLLRFVFALLLLSAFTPARAQSPNRPTVEIFLLKSTVPKVPHAGFFQPTAALLADTAFLSDADISGDVISGTGRQRRYSFLVSSSGQQKFKQLQGLRIPLDGGQPFAVVLNGQPLFGGYFWNTYSSFGAEWLVIPAWAAPQCLQLYAGLPSAHFTKEHPDPREALQLLEALRQTGRLKQE